MKFHAAIRLVLGLLLAYALVHCTTAPQGNSPPPLRPTAAGIKPASQPPPNPAPSQKHSEPNQFRAPSFPGSLDNSLALATLTVSPVHTSLPFNPYGPRLTGDQFRSALISQLRKSRLFQDVTADPKADYRLESSIVRHEPGDPQSSGSRACLWVDYTLINNRTQAIVWQGQKRHEYTWQLVAEQTDPVTLFQLQLLESPLL